MNKFRLTIKLLVIATFMLAFASIAQAQATRTWVSGVGDDANPCSRTAPCKTFAGAISKTAINGEIDCLDPGGFGAVTITKSLTIDGTHGGGFGSILASGTNGVIINAVGSATDPLRSVRLRNLSINGAGSSGGIGTRTGIRGIKVLSALDVYIDGCVIDNFSDRGISDERTAGTNNKLYVTDTIVRNTGASNIVVIPTGASTVKVELDNVHAEGSATNSGIVFDASGGTIKATVRDSYGTGNSANGLTAVGASDVMTEGCVFSNNATGVQVNSPAVLRLTNSTITHNTTSMAVATQPQVSSAGNNNINGNTTNNLPTGPPINQN